MLHLYEPARYVFRALEVPSMFVLSLGFSLVGLLEDKDVQMWVFTGIAATFTALIIYIWKGQTERIEENNRNWKLVIEKIEAITKEVTTLGAVDIRLFERMEKSEQLNIKDHQMLREFCTAEHKIMMEKYAATIDTVIESRGMIKDMEDQIEEYKKNYNKD